MLDLRRREIVLSVSENKGVDQLRSYCKNQAKIRFCHDAAHFIQVMKKAVDIELSTKAQKIEPLYEKNNNLGFRPGPIQTIMSVRGIVLAV